MIKKTVRIGLLAFASLLTFSACSSDDDNTVGIEQGTSSSLPTTARNFVSEYFAGYNYNNVEKLSAANENGAAYIATMKEGVEIQFDKDGQWVNIDGKNQVLPDAVTKLLPATAVTYVEQNAGSTTKSTSSKLIAILKLLRLKYGYQIDLDGDKAFIFDKIGEFLSNDASSVNAGSVNTSQLPQAARDFISTNLPSESYLYVAQLNIPFYGVIYNAYLTNGYKVKFDKDGVLKEVDRDDKAIPASVLSAILPQNAVTYLNTKFPSIGVESVEIKSDKYEVELLNDLDLEFDLQGNLTASDNDNSSEQKIDPTALPQIARDFVTSAFPNGNGYKEISKNAVPDDGVMYEVKLNDNTQLKFDINGNWLEAKAKKGVLPQAFINTLPAKIISYLSTNQAGIGVEKVSKDNKGYDVDLINGIEIEFNTNGDFISIDR